MRSRNGSFIRQDRRHRQFLHSYRCSSIDAPFFTHQLHSCCHYAAFRLQRRAAIVRRPRLTAAAHWKYLPWTLQCHQFHSGRVPIR